MGGSSKTTQENKPPAWAAPLFKLSAKEATNLYNSGAGGNTYQGSTVAPLSGTTMSGVNQLANAGANWDTSGTRGLFGQIGAGAVSNPYQNKLSELASSASGPSYAEQYLGNYANGSNLENGGNPYYRQRLESDLEDTASQVQSLFSGAGRYGSGANNEVLADTLSDQRNAALENDWNREQANQFNAVGMMDAANSNRLGLRGNLLSSAGGLYGQGIGQGLSAAGSMAGLDQQNFQNRLSGAGATLQAGNIVDNQAQSLLQDEINKWYANDNQDWTRLGMLQGAAAGAAGPYGTQIATQRTSPGIGTILGGVGSIMGGK